MLGRLDGPAPSATPVGELRRPLYPAMRTGSARIRRPRRAFCHVRTFPPRFEWRFTPRILNGTGVLVNTRAPRSRQNAVLAPTVDVRRTALDVDPVSQAAPPWAAAVEPTSAVFVMERNLEAGRTSSANPEGRC